MKNLKTVSNPISIEDLHEETQEAIKNYLDFANTSPRTGSNISDAVCVFFDYNIDDNMDNYAEIPVLALQAFTKPEISSQFKDVMGQHYYEMFIELLPRITKLIEWLRSDANVAELRYSEYEMNGSTHESNRIHLIQEKRKYESMLQVLIDNRVEWDEHDKKFRA